MAPRIIKFPETVEEKRAIANEFEEFLRQHIKN